MTTAKRASEEEVYMGIDDEDEPLPHYTQEICVNCHARFLMYSFQFGSEIVLRHRLVGRPREAKRFPTVQHDDGKSVDWHLMK